MCTIRYRAVGLALLLAAVLTTWRLTPVVAATTIFSNNFDGQSAGALVTGADPNQFGGMAGAANLSVENTVAASAPNALAVTLNTAGFAFAAKQFSTAYTTYTLAFNLQLGPDFTVASPNYVVLAQTLPVTSSNVGKVDVIVPADDRIRLDYTDSAGQHHFLWGGFVVPKGSWHTVELRVERMALWSPRPLAAGESTLMRSRRRCGHVVDVEVAGGATAGWREPPAHREPGHALRA